MGGLTCLAAPLACNILAVAQKIGIVSSQENGIAQFGENFPFDTPAALCQNPM